jgi:broad specificity phosphatase PhoE
MTAIALIPWGENDWTKTDRFASRTPLPLIDPGVDQVRQWADQLAGRELTVVYSGTEASSAMTAEIVARRSEVKHRAADELNEVDLGLWEGLTREQVEARFPKLFRCWVDDPETVHLPQGEPMIDAWERLTEKLDRLMRKHREGTVAVVLGPIALSMARCYLEGVPMSEFTEHVACEPVWYHCNGEKVPVAGAAPTTMAEG